MYKRAPHSAAAATAWPHVTAATASTIHTDIHTYIQTRMHANIQTLPAEAAAKHTNTCNIHIHIQHTHTHTHSPVAAVSAVSSLASYVQRAWTPRLRHCSCLARRWQRRSVDYGHVSVASLQRNAHIGGQVVDAVERNSQGLSRSVGGAGLAKYCAPKPGRHRLGRQLCNVVRHRARRR